MDPDVSLLAWLLAALLSAALAWLAMAGALHLSAAREHGFVHWVMPALLVIMAAGVWLSGRDLTSNFLLPEFAPDPPRPAVLNVMQPVVSLLLLAISAERILSHWLTRAQHSTQQALAPALAFALFWVGTIAAPAWAAAHPYWSHNLLYPLLIGLAATLCGPQDHLLALRATRNALLLLMLAGVLLIPIAPTLVLDRQYGQGLIPGLPRFGGLATHPVAMGLLAQLGLLCLQMQAFERRWLDRCAWLLGLSVLFVAQSKTAWLAFLLCSGSVLALRWVPRLRAQLGNVHDGTPALAWIALALLGVSACLWLLLFGNLSEGFQRFMYSSEGSQLGSLTGRDRIWAIAWEEWQLHPVWGWGLQIWDDSYRRAIGLANATHAHNQFMDTLSRSGLVGATALTLYLGVLCVLSLRCARASQGLSLALLLALLLRAGSEVPLLLIGYGPDLIIHLLLLITLAAHRSAVATSLATRVRLA